MALTGDERAIFEAELEFLLSKFIFKERDINLYRWFDPWYDKVVQSLLDLVETIKSKESQPFTGMFAKGNEIGWRWIRPEDVAATGVINTSGDTFPATKDWIGTASTSPITLTENAGVVLFGVEYVSGLTGWRYFSDRGYEHFPLYWPYSFRKFGAEFGFLPFFKVKEVTPEAKLGVALIFDASVSTTLNPLGIVVGLASKYLESIPPSLT